MNRIQVAVGIVTDKKKRVLVGQRTVQDQYFQKWEFPGGKLELGETPEQALTRELHEELGIKVLASSPFLTLDHDYPDRSVRLSVLKVTRFSGNVRSRERQALRWVSLETISTLDFLSGNQFIIERLFADRKLQAKV